MKETRINLGIVLFAIGFSAGVALLDLTLDQGDVPWHGLFVIPVIWIALWSAEDDVLPLTAMALLVSILALLPGFLSPGNTGPFFIGERLVVLSTIWITVVIALLRKRARRTFKWITFSGKH